MLINLWITDMLVEDYRIIGKSIRITYRFVVENERIPTNFSKTITYRKHNWIKDNNMVDFDKVDRISDILLSTNYPILNGVVNINSRNYKNFWQLNRALWRTSNQNFVVKRITK